jgi:Carbohydrate esterase, sialic acid-specific acetylesterase
MGAADSTFGPEIAFGVAMGQALPKERIGLVKLARPGTPIGDWSPANPRSLYAELVHDAKAARASAPEAQLAAMLWVQGERDARSPDLAATYSGNLRVLIAAVRRDLGAPDLPFLCAQVNPPYPFAPEIRAAQAALPSQVQRTAVVSTDGLRKNADSLHYSASGQIELGLRFAQSLLSFLKPGT